MQKAWAYVYDWYGGSTGWFISDFVFWFILIFRFILIFLDLKHFDLLLRLVYFFLIVI